MVSGNYLSGIFGGITLRQWRSVLDIPGVEVAAPVANLGYVLLYGRIGVPINELLTRDAVQMYRFRISWTANRLSHYAGGTAYVYYTRRHRFIVRPGEDIREVVPGARPLPVCDGFNYKRRPAQARSPFAEREIVASALLCFSARSPAPVYPSLVGGEVGLELRFWIPMLLSAIDPLQEGRLVGLNRTIVSGRGLAQTDRPQLRDFAGELGTGTYLTVPVIASDTSFIDEAAQLAIDRLDVPSGLNLPRLLASSDAFRFVTNLTGHRVGGEALSSEAMYRAVLSYAARYPQTNIIGSYRTVSAVDYQVLDARCLAARPTMNPYGVWRDPVSGFFPAPPSNQDVQYRHLAEHSAPLTPIAPGAQGNTPLLRIQGTFDPTKLPGFNPLSRVPLESYYPPVAEPADPASVRALGGRPLHPTMNIGGYIQQPPLLLTSLAGLRPFIGHFSGASPSAPISAIRVRVAGVSGTDELSLARIKAAAQAIQQRTGLAVDITAGSSPTPMLIRLPAGRFGQPSLLVREAWVKKGVAVVILEALDEKSLALFLLVLTVTSLFLVNGSFASVRTRRAEIGALLAFGWSRNKVFTAVLGEIALIGLGAGVVGTGVAAALVMLLALKMQLVRTVFVAPVAALLATVAGLLPAWQASRGTPLQAVHPTVTEKMRGRPVRRIGVMAAANLRRSPGRTVVAAAGLFVGVGALALLLSITLAFRGALVGTALGGFISVQIRGVDYLGVVLAVVLPAFSVSDVLSLNIRDRAPELVTLRASGWRDAHLALMVTAEGVGIGLLGSIAGAGCGIALSALVGGSPAKVALAGLLAAGAGTLVALVASLVPASLVSRMAPPTILAEE